MRWQDCRFFLPLCLSLIITAEAEVELDSAVERIQQTVETAEKSSNPSPWLAKWYFDHGDQKRGLQTIYKVLDGIKPEMQGHPFEAYAIADVYLHYSGLFDEGHRQKWKLLANTRGAYSYNLLPFPSNYSTPNLRMVGGVTWYLSTLGLGLENLPKDYPPPSDPDRSGWIRRVIGQIVRTGLPEYAARPYCCYNAVPLLYLHASAKDSEIAEHALLAYEAFLATAAPTWLAGHWPVTPGRSYGDILGQHPNSNINFLWVHFGGLTNSANPSGMSVAALPYRPPDYLKEIALRRDKPYVATSRISYEKSDDPDITHLPSDIQQYTFMNRSYAIFSQPTMPGAILQEQQVYPNGVMWVEPKGDPSFLWATIPGDASSHTHGMIARGLEFVQHEESWLMVGRPAPTDSQHFIQGFIPRGYQAIIDDASSDGRIYLAYANVLIAISLPSHFSWNPNVPMPSLNRPPKTKNKNLKKGQPSVPSTPFPSDGPGFIYPGNSLALALETRHPEDVSGANSTEKLKNFREAIRSTSLLTLTNGLAIYKTATGHTLQRRVGDPGIVDGIPYDIYQMPFLENPWMHQDYQQVTNQPSTLTISIDGRTHLYDFKNWSVTHRDGPARPLHLTAQGTSSTIRLRWSASPGEPTGYLIKRSAISGGPYEQVGKSSGTTLCWEDTSAPNNTSSHYVVTAVNSGGESDPSPEAVSTVGKNPPLIPTGIHVVPGDNTVTLNWFPSEGTDKYSIHRSTTEGGPYELLGTTSKTEFTDTNVTNNVNYHYVVTGIDNGRESGFSNELIAMPLPPLLPAPSDVTVTMSNGAAVISWKSVPGTIHYDVKKGFVPGGLFNTIHASWNETTWSDSRTASNALYSVNAVNARGEGISSPIISARTGKPIENSTSSDNKPNTE